MFSRSAVLAAALFCAVLPAVATADPSAPAAKSRVSLAKDMIRVGRNDDAESSLDAAEKFLVGLPEAEKAPIAAEIKALREQLAKAIKPEDARMVSAAKGKVKQAKSNIESGYGADDVRATLDSAEKFLANVPDAHKADVLAEIKAMRDKLAGGGKPTTPTPDGGKPATTGANADEIAANLSRAKGHVNSAKSLVETRRLDNVEYALEQAEKALSTVPDAQKATLVDQILTIRTDLASAEKAEQVRRIDEELGRHLRTIDSSLPAHPQNSAAAITHVTQRLTEEDVKKWLSPAQLRKYEADLDAARTRVAAFNKGEVLSRAGDLLKKLEEQLASDPFKGKDQREAYNVSSGMESLKKGIVSWLKDLPADDADAKAMRDRLAVADQKILKASDAWGKAQVDAQVGNDWASIKKDITGWEDEANDPKAGPLDAPHLPKTGAAIQRIGYWLGQPETKKIRQDNKGDATLEAMYTEAEKVFSGAADKLNAAFNKVIDDAEKIPTPMRSFELDRATSLRVSAEYAFAGTKYQEPNVARAKKLDAKWKAEIAAIMKARQELYDKLSGEADVSWPKILAPLNAQANFDPKAAKPGQTILLKGVYNRSGWDFSGRNHAFAMRLNGIPVAGNYEPHVLKALEHAWYELKLNVNDHIEWDVVGVVEGPGKIGERITVILKDKSTNLEIGKIEEYRPEDCINIKIIALRAGPVAVGPGK
jgi:hypothetical protein